MALCRFVLLDAPLHRHPLQVLVKPTLSSQLCPYPSIKFTPLPLLRQKKISICTPRCTSSLFSSTMEASPEGYRRNVGICLINPSKQIFAASRLDIPDAWQMPQVPYWLTYDFPPEVREKLKHQWGSDWKGQAQKWFLLKFTGKEDEINLLGDGKEKPEFGDWSWMPPERVVELAVDFKRPIYKEVVTAFAPYFH
ncbi:hypothetical protein Ancab_001138 [Ancistrocladus abbreviatus]